MASTAAVTPLGLLHMRPIQRWLHDRVPRWAWRHGTYRVSRQPALPGEWRPTRPTASCFTPCPRRPSARTRWHTAGLGAYANMRFHQWACSHRPCARSGRTKSMSFWWRLTGPIVLGSQNWCSSRQPLLGKFLWGGFSFLREGAPTGTHIQTCGISTCGSWMGRRGSRWATSSGSKHYHFC